MLRVPGPLADEAFDEVGPALPARLGDRPVEQLDDAVRPDHRITIRNRVEHGARLCGTVAANRVRTGRTSGPIGHIASRVEDTVTGP